MTTRETKEQSAAHILANGRGLIDPSKVLIATPAFDGKVETGYCGGLAACASAHLFGNMVFLNSISSISLARNRIIQGFLQNDQYDWLVFIDSDVAFSERDFRLLMDYPLRNEKPSHFNDEHEEAASRTEEGHVLISCAEYARKVDNDSAVRLGFGFCRIHRSVFDALNDLKKEDGSERVNAFFFDGSLCYDYCISGCMSDGHWLGEDHGFFSLCRMAGITPRIEQRTNLIHWGRKAYPYTPPVLLEGAQ